MRVLAFDIGSSSVRAALFDARGRRIPEALVARAYTIRSTSDGGAELKPETLLVATRECFRRLKREAFDVVTGCGFWHGLLGISSDGRAITPIYTWADSRCRADAAQLRRVLPEEEFLQRTGCMLRFPFWTAKLAWLRRTDKRLFHRVRWWVSPSDWLFMQLFGEFATSESMASGTGLFNRAERRWDRQLCDRLGIELGQLPPIQNDSPGSVWMPIGDGAANNLGSGADIDGVAAINLGTSAAIRVMLDRHASTQVPSGLFRYVVDSKTDVLGGAVSNAGNLREWCYDTLRLPKTAQLCRSTASSNPLVALPYLVGERGPDWTEAPGLIFGLTKATTAEEIHAALITSAFYRLANVLDVIKSAVRVSRLVVSGGFAKSARALQTLADVLGHDLEIASETETSLRGAAIHALRQVGKHPNIRRSRRLVRHRAQWTKQHQCRRRKQQELQAMADAQS